MSTSRLNAIRAGYEAAQQGHVFTFWDKLSSAEQEAFLDQLEQIDPVRVNKLFKASVEADEAAKNASADAIEPLPPNVVESVVGALDKEAAYRARGLEAIAAGRVAVLLMAGGQGTRLGSADPKGCYDIGLPSKKSLFQQQAERIRRLEVVAAKTAGKNGSEVKVPWYIMTSEPTHDATRAFFGWAKDGSKLDVSKPVNFGLDENQVFFFKQGTHTVAFPKIRI